MDEYFNGNHRTGIFAPCSHRVAGCSSKRSFSPSFSLPNEIVSIFNAFCFAQTLAYMYKMQLTIQENTRSACKTSRLQVLLDVSCFVFFLHSLYWLVGEERSPCSGCNGKLGHTLVLSINPTHISVHWQILGITQAAHTHTHANNQMGNVSTISNANGSLAHCSFRCINFDHVYRASAIYNIFTVETHTITGSLGASSNFTGRFLLVFLTIF